MEGKFFLAPSWHEEGKPQDKELGISKKGISLEVSPYFLFRTSVNAEE